MRYIAYCFIAANRWLAHSSVLPGRRLAALLVITILLSAITPGARTAAARDVEPPVPASPMLQQYEDWSAHPSPPLIEDGSMHEASDSPAAEGEEAAFSLYSNRVVFQRFQPYEGNYDIYTFELYAYQSYPNYIPITDTPWDEVYPRLSKDLSQVVYVSDRDGSDDIFRIPSGGGGYTLLTNHPAVDTMPVFSPDGKKIAFVSNRTGNPEIFVMNVDGSGVTQLTSSAEIDVDPDWSPDGASLIWVRRSGSSGSVQIMNADGSNQRSLLGPFNYPGRPIFSPSGKRIALQADLNDDGWLDIVEAAADGSGWMGLPYPKDGNYDFLMGGWTADESTLLFNIVQYRLYDNEWYIEGATFAHYSRSSYYYSPSYGMSYAFYPDVRGISDASSVSYPDPVSRITALPQFSPYTGFPINFTVQLGDSRLELSRVEAQYASSPYALTWTELSAEGIVKNGSTVTGTLIFPGGSPGSKIYFRIRAIDSMDKYETIHITPDTSTTLAAWQVAGQVIDARGEPAAGVTINGSSLNGLPAATGSDGKFLLQAQTLSSASLNGSKAGYGAFPTMYLTGDFNQQVMAMLPPTQNLLINGDFEDSSSLTNGWQVSGDALAQSFGGHSGYGGLRLAAWCSSYPCMNSSGALIPETTTKTLHLAVMDKQGRTHFVMSGNNYQIFYGLRGPDGKWQALRNLDVSYHPSNLVVDDNGLAHLLIPVNQKIYYFTNNPNGTYSYSLLGSMSTSNIQSNLAVDQNGRLHWVYSDHTGTVYYRYRDPGKEWSQTETIVKLKGTSQPVPKAAVDSQGIVHIITWPTGMVDYQRLPNRMVNAVTLPQLAGSSGKLLTAPDGQVHLVVKNLQYLWHSRWLPDLGWRVEGMANLGNQQNLTNVQFDSMGNLHVSTTQYLYYAFDRIKGWLHLTLAPGSAVFERHPVASPLGYKNLQVVVDPQNRLYALADTGEGIYWQTTADAAADQSIQISQTVSIPADMAHPTLSFLYRTSSAFGTDQSQHFRVRFTPNDGSAVDVPIIKGSTGWRNAWADLSAWAGETGSVEITFQQAANSPYAWVDLDEISLGDYPTPVVRQTAPDLLLLPVEAGYWLRLIGDNLRAGTRVWIDGKEVTARFDSEDGTFWCQVPQNIKVGSHDIYVKNPDGTSSTAYGMLRVGYQAYIPTIRK